MAEPLRFKVAKRKRHTIEFYLVAPGDDPEQDEDGPYHFIAPKSAMMVLPVVSGDADDQGASLRAVFDWLGTGLNDWDWENGQGREVVTEGGENVPAVGEKRPVEWQGPQVQRIEARLRDGSDDLDIDTLSEVIKGLAEQAAERPTT